MTNPFEIRKVYSWDVYPAALLGTNYKNVTVLAIMDRDTANKEIDTQALHVNFFPSLPAGTPNDPNGYDYIKIRTTAGQTTILGIAWINLASVTVVDSRTITVKISDVGAADITRVRNALVQNGFGSLDISIS